MRDLHNNISVVAAITPEVLDADKESSALDLQGYEAAELAIHVGVGGITFSGTNKVEFVLTHSDDDSTYSEVEASDVEGVDSVTDGIIHSLTAEHAAGNIITLGYIGGKRYLKLKADFSGTHGTGTPMSAVLVKGRPHQA